MLSRICEEGLATSLLDAMEQPLEQVMRILEKRGYAWAKETIERDGVKLDDLPDSPMITLAQEIEAGLAAEQWAAMKARAPKKKAKKD